MAPEATYVDLPDRFRMAVRAYAPQGDHPARPVVLVHGLASNSLLWNGVAQRLATAGHPTWTVDLRGHGHSQAPEGGYDTDTCADDLAGLIEILALQKPMVAGQSWGGNVVLSLAARHPDAVGAVACIDGGWLRLRDNFDTFDECWQRLAPPTWDGVRWDDVVARITAAQADWPDDAAQATLGNLMRTESGGVRSRLERDHHREILRSLFEGDPATWYPSIKVPVLLVPAGEPSAAVHAAAAALTDARIVAYPGAHHDLHAQHPDRLAADLLTWQQAFKR